jgi:hypothetical protein
LLGLPLSVGGSTWDSRTPRSVGRQGMRHADPSCGAMGCGLGTKRSDLDPTARARARPGRSAQSTRLSPGRRPPRRTAGRSGRGSLPQIEVLGGELSANSSHEDAATLALLATWPSRGHLLTPIEHRTH